MPGCQKVERTRWPANLPNATDRKLQLTAPFSGCGDGTPRGSICDAGHGVRNVGRTQPCRGDLSNRKFGALVGRAAMITVDGSSRYRVESVCFSRCKMGTGRHILKSKWTTTTTSYRAPVGRYQSHRPNVGA